MKKLIIAVGVLICILAAALAALVVRGNAGGTGFLEVIKNGGKVSQAAMNEEIVNAHYDGELLCTQGFETITYTDRDFKVEFANPFYAEGEGTRVNVVFYDENHGFLMRSIGQGTNSEFFECYRTADGSASWDRCAQDLWFEVDAENIVEMTGPKGLVYIKTSPDLILGGDVTEITFSADGGDSWSSYIDENVDETHLKIRGMIEELSLEERISMLLVPAIEELADEDEPEMTIADMVEEAMPGGVLWCDASEMGTWSFENQMRQAQSFMMDETGLPLFLVSTYERRPGSVEETAADAETVSEADEEGGEAVEEPEPAAYYAVLEEAPSASIEDWTSGLKIYTDGRETEGFGLFSEEDAEGAAVKAVVAEDPESAVNALKQGAQLLILPEGYEDVRDAVFDAVEAKNLTEIQINRALYQVLYAKLAYLQEEE